jgi:DNA-binding transcriptional LysR family regulator
MMKFLDPRWQLFIRVAEYGSISGASAALDMPQSVLSRQIAQLEAEAGARLFRRTGRGVVLTELGEWAYPRIVALMRQADELADELQSHSGQPMGDVHFGVLPSTVRLIAGPLCSEIQRQWPRVRIHLTEGSSAQLEEWIAQGRLDLSLLLREGDTANPHETLLACLPLDLVVPAGHPLATRTSIPFKEVAALPLVLPGEPHPLRARLAEIAREQGLSLTQAVEASSIHLQHEIVANHGGFAITAGVLAPQDEHRLAAVRIVEPSLSRSIVLGVTAHRPHTLATRSVAQLVRSICPALLQSG